MWRLTWESPHKTGDVFPSYDVRILGHCFTSRNIGTLIHAFSPEDGDGLIDIWAGKNPAEIWIPSGVEFYLVNYSIKVHVEIYNASDVYRE